MKDVKWAWDPRKALSNFQKHHVSFELAEHVFDDPLILSLDDPETSQERWRSVGQVGGVTLLVVHTAPELNPESGIETGRIISARRATRSERLAYENDC
jgi:uncharacterized DUF497 family protein